MAKKSTAPVEDEAQGPVEQKSVEELLEEYNASQIALATEIWEYDDLPFILSVEEQLFVRSYMIDRNEVAALKRLGYGFDAPRMRAKAKKFLANVEVQNAIDYLAKRLMQRLAITAENVQRKIAEIAFWDPRQVMTWDRHGPQIAHSRFWSEGDAANISSIKSGQYGLEMKFYDRQKAIGMLAQQLKLMPDEGDAATNARIAADETMDRISNIFGRLFPGGKHLIEAKIAERRAIRDGRIPGPITIEAE